MLLVVTTVVREAPLEGHGFVYVIDWDRKEVVRKFQPPPPRATSLGPRGGARGFRGVTFSGDVCYIANYDTLFGYDKDWNLVDTISHKLFADIHEIESDGDCIWITSTGVDGILKINGAGHLLEQHFLGELSEEERAQLGMLAREICRKTDHRIAEPLPNLHVAHPNGLSINGNRIYVTLFRPGAVIALNPFEVIWRDDAYYGLHSSRVFDHGKRIYLAASYRSEFVGMDLRSEKILFRVGLTGTDRHDKSLKGRIQQVLHHPLFYPMFRRLPVNFVLKHARPLVFHFLPTSRPGWSRGIAVVDDSHIFGGTSPATISLLNTKTELIEDQLQLEEDSQHSVFSVAVDRRTI